MDCGPPGSSVHGILQARILEWVAISFSGDHPEPGIKPESPELQGRFFTIWATGEAQCRSPMWNVKLSLKSHLYHLSFHLLHSLNLTFICSLLSTLEVAQTMHNHASYTPNFNSSSFMLPFSSQNTHAFSGILLVLYSVSLPFSLAVVEISRGIYRSLLSLAQNKLFIV